MESIALKLVDWACGPGFSGFLHAKNVMQAIVKMMVVFFMSVFLAY
jgi:hypothetical protein